MIPLRWPEATLFNPPRWDPEGRVRWGALGALVVVSLVAGSGMARAVRHPGGRTNGASVARRKDDKAAAVGRTGTKGSAPGTGGGVAARAANLPAAGNAAAAQGVPQGAVPPTRSADVAGVPANARIGAIFTGSGSDGDHHCTASVVGPDLILTAAHCTTDGNRFSPGYHKGHHPYGLWVLGKRLVDRSWDSRRDEDHDIAFVQVKLRDGKHLGDVVGYNAVHFDPSVGTHVTVTGYPADSHDSVTGSDRTARFNKHQMRIHVPGMAGGTSGGPWIAPDGTVVGVIGGHEDGGDDDDVSYSVYFDDSVRSLYDKAYENAERTRQ